MQDLPPHLQWFTLPPADVSANLFLLYSSFSPLLSVDVWEGLCPPLHTPDGSPTTC